MQGYEAKLTTGLMARRITYPTQSYNLTKQYETKPRKHKSNTQCRDMFHSRTGLKQPLEYVLMPKCQNGLATPLKNVTI